MNKVVGIGLTGLALYALVKIAQVKNIADNISATLIKPRIHSVSGAGVIFRTGVKITNPTADSITLTKPVIFLTTKGEAVTQSKTDGKEITIKALGQTNIDTIELEVGWTVLGKYIAGIFGKIPELIFAYKSGDFSHIGNLLGIPLEMTFSTYSSGIFYQSTPVKIM